MHWLNQELRYSVDKSNKMAAMELGSAQIENY